MLVKIDYEKYAKILKAISDPKRLKIIDMLSGGELCACKIQEEFQITQPTLSHDMKLLCDAELVCGRKEGKWTHYSLNEEKLEEVFQVMKEVVRKKQTKLYVLTGFLGSGKTTVLLKLLEKLKDSRVGIIQNEFGKLGIDGTILRDDDIHMVEINRGSIFCTCLKLQFVTALAEMVEKNFDYLFVESSGWGDPSNLEEILQAAKIVSGKEYEVGGVLCFVDAVNFSKQLEAEESTYRQVKHAHLCVITKTDVATEEQINKAYEKIREINPVCEITTSENGVMDYEFLKKDLLVYQWAESEESTNTVETKPKSVFLEYDGEIEKEKMELFLKAVAPSLHRVKGFCNLKESGWTQIDVVGSLVDFKETSTFEKSQLVFISKIGPAAIKTIFSAWQEYVGTEMKLKN